MASCLEHPQLFPGKLPSINRYSVEVAIYLNDRLKTAATTANAHYMSPYDAFSG